jgi:hypothetical protein
MPEHLPNTTEAKDDRKLVGAINWAMWLSCLTFFGALAITVLHWVLPRPIPGGASISDNASDFMTIGIIGVSIVTALRLLRSRVIALERRLGGTDASSSSRRGDA